MQVNILKEMVANTKIDCMQSSFLLHYLPDNVKALFRRAKAHVGAWNPEQAKKDFERAMELDPSLGKAVKKELQNLDELQRAKDQQDKQKLQGMFDTGRS